ncbi:sodium/calcium exchanger regulatory protein 1 [Folsomia candida]|uniref:Cellular retinoic acid-binding protein 1 n=1 Tax=Folsomia candida TaxID=158441 RepID=A0A226EGK3_FOLCA|nr:sodium/calcium exchanger regulatory protein 1 [Folsomia candida]XP_035704891.1 sodium/calcium exchanger regulatory protein 1 [Folsomia candida]XP_035704892.1 sodium/calcium exchanger regulatory protein 1 [Folsomia candida]XP_035704894.1 sodium/calcium exchanger regulatory protein 1 [Folsomia candida]OXA56745.1 Cellular retinoic acid-binding protein 1 [Folsomia candida]
MVSIVGKYEFDQSDVKDDNDYLKSLGVGLVLRKVLTTARPKLEILYAPDTDEWCIKTATTFKTTTFRFKVGQKVEDETFDARKCTTMGEIFADDKIVLHQTCEEGPNVIVVKEKFDGDKLRMTLIADNVSTTQIFKRVTPA